MSVPFYVDRSIIADTGKQTIQALIQLYPLEFGLRCRLLLLICSSIVVFCSSTDGRLADELQSRHDRLLADVLALVKDLGPCSHSHVVDLISNSDTANQLAFHHLAAQLVDLGNVLRVRRSQLQSE